MFDLQVELSARVWPRWVAGSAAIHVLLAAVLLWSGPRVRVQKFVPGTAHGSRIELSYLPSGASFEKAEGRQPKSHPQTTRVHASEPELSRVAPPKILDLQSVEQTENSPALKSGGAGTSSNDALGTDNIQIALTTYSPSPRPDLSRLPRGAQGEVVLDVTIDSMGRVADLRVLQALGYGIDEPVVETVRTWTFRPATKDGVPVASMQELHFHFGPV